MLNEFIRAGSKRRSFAHGKIDIEDQKLNQLKKARIYLNYGREHK